MASPREAVNGLPANWKELFPIAADVHDIQLAHAALTSTLPNRYEKYNERYLMEMMIPRPNRPGNPGGDWISGLRIFLRDDGKMSLFFFLRIYNKNLQPAYCMTVGAYSEVTKEEIYNDAKTICSYMKQDTGNHRLDIINKDPAGPSSAAVMPPVANGGPWPQEWIALLQRWKDSGFPRLELGKVVAPGYTATHAGSKIVLRGSGTLPDGNYQAWLEPVVEEGKARSYVHYWQPLAGQAPAPPRPFSLVESFAPPTPPTFIVIRDADGDHSVPVP